MGGYITGLEVRPEFRRELTGQKLEKCKRCGSSYDFTKSDSVFAPVCMNEELCPTCYLNSQHGFNITELQAYRIFDEAFGKAVQEQEGMSVEKYESVRQFARAFKFTEDKK